MEPYYQARHGRQTVGLEGPDLAGTRQREILATAKEFSRDSILQFDLTQFHVASKSNPGGFYSVNLNQSTCDCADFPRIRFCKHIAAIQIHFPDLFPEETSPQKPLEATAEAPAQAQRVSSPEETIYSLTNEISVLLHRLQREPSDSSPAVLEAVRSAKYSLSAAIASASKVSALPNKQYVAPNQGSWTETAERMGVKKAPKRCCLPEERGLMDRSIGVAKGKRRRVYSDPYAGGERSGKCAKPDALSAAANTRARIPPSASPAPTIWPPPTQLPAHVMNRHDLQEKQSETTAAPGFEPIFCPRRLESRASKAHIRSSHGLHKPFLPDEDSRHRHQRLNAPKQWINNASTKHNKKYRVR
jgi:hypothetical protein